MPADLARSLRLTGARSPGTLVARTTARDALRSAVLWGYVFGVTVASSAVSYARLYKTPAERQRLADTFGANHAASALFGPAPQLQTVAGFTVLKASMTLTIIGAVWGLLTSTSLLRGSEDTGRWDLLATGQTTRARAAAQAVGGLTVAAAVLFGITALVTVVVGRLSTVHIAVGPAVYFALALVAAAVMFLGAGAVTSQLAPNRRLAAGYAGAFLGISYGLRMVADAGVGLHALVWASPLGWVEQLQPLTDPNPWALVPIAGFTAALGALAVHLAGRRDVGAGTWADRTAHPAHLRLLRGPTTLTVRLTRSSTVAWVLAVGSAGLLTGIVARAAGTTIVGSSVQQVFARLGAPGSGTSTFLGVTFLLLGIVIAFQAASQVGATRAEEADARLDHLLTAPVSRSRWLAGRLAVVTVGLLASGVATGAFSWLGTTTQGAGLRLTTALGAGMNAAVPAIFVLGVGALAVGVRPRAATAAVYAVLGWSALLDLVGGFFAQDHLLLDTSLFHQVSSAPAVAPDWPTDAVVLVLGLAAMAVGVAALNRRDLQPA